MENDYIVTTHGTNDTHGLDTLTWDDLHAAKFAFNKPFCLCLSDNQIFFSEQVVRVIPKKRMVAFGTWHDKPVVAKLFFDPKQAKRHMEKDIAGIKSLQKNKIPTPELLYEGYADNKHIYVLIFERIMDVIQTCRRGRIQRSIYRIQSGTVYRMRRQAFVYVCVIRRIYRKV